MTSITWASLRYIQEAATILGSQNRTQGSCVLNMKNLFLFYVTSYIYVILSDIFHYNNIMT